MKLYEWKLCSFTGRVEAENIKDAFKQATDFYFNLPHVSDTCVRVDILVYEVKE